MLNVFFTKFYKIEKKSCLIHSVYHW